MIAAPRLTARITGALYVVTIAGGISGLLLRQGLIVKGDAAATAALILGSVDLYRLSFTVELVGTLAYVAITALLYGLLRPAGPFISRVAMAFGLAGCAIGLAVSPLLLAPLVLLKSAPYLAAFSPAQLEGLAYAFLRLQGQGYTVAMTCFGLYCGLLGWLVFRSTFMPRIIGVLLALTCLGWSLDGLSEFLAPELSTRLGPLPMLLGLLGEGSLTAWLLVMGVNPGKWRARAAEL
ncbi:DUF4386 domain-containing protein [Phenylobacterium sp.]|uniref:DUF4386 domain-containing protein n=1 Tax=Phenylobacterium sp. TaxID=1871053 RepID=UPI003BAAAC37